MTTQRWSWHRVKMELHQSGMTLSGLAKIHEMHTSNFTALRTKSHSKAEGIVADYLQQPLEVVFPDRYPKQKSRILNSKVAAKEKARKEAAERAAA